MTDSLEKSLAFHGLGQRHQSAFRIVSQVLRRHGPRVVRQFYERIRAESDAARYFTSEEAIARAQGTQLEHWTHLFSGRIDEEYVARAKRVGQVHARIGLEPSLYFGGYAFILGELIERQTMGWWGWLPWVRRRARANSALVRAALFDMNVAITTVLDCTLGEVTDVARQVEGGAREFAASSRDLAMRTEQQANDLTQAVESMTRVTQTIAQTSSTTQMMLEMFEQARSEAEHGDEVVTEAIAAMQQIEGSSAQISQITDLIDGIAFQTNLLALNAGVEAARAGDAGKGFAVVASEVRALAQRSADAARNIKDLIQASSGQVKSGASLVTQTGDSLRGIVEQLGGVLQLMQSVSAASEVQKGSVGEISGAVSRIETMTQQNAAMAEQANALSVNLASDISALARLVSRFHKDEADQLQAALQASTPATPRRLAA